MLRVGDGELKLGEATRLVDAYARDHATAIRFYDFDGDPEGEVRPSKGPISLSDIGRLAIVTPKLTAEEVARLLGISTVQWSSVAPTARLEHADHGEPDGLYFAMHSMWAQVQKCGVGSGKVSKLLHLKRPLAFPLLDRTICDAYAKRHRKTSDYWRLIRDDLIEGAGELDRIRDTLASSKNRDVQRAARLPALRVLYIIGRQRQ